jgi:hypothetical protein
MNKQKYKEDLKKIGNETINDLEPVIKKGVNNIFDFVKEIIDDAISTLFEKRKTSNKRRILNEK